MKTLQLRAFTWSWRAPTGRPRGRSSPGTKGKYMGKLEGKIGLITGGNSGIGLATAKEFVNEGAYVFITGRRDPQLTAAVKEIGSTVTAVQGDVSNPGDLGRLFAQIKREKGRLDVVFANAGVAKYAPCWAHGSIVWPSTRPRRGSEYANDGVDEYPTIIAEPAAVAVEGRTR